MTNIANNVAAKLAVAVVAVAMAFSAFAAPAQAQTTDELQAMINDLLAQVASLQGQLGGDAGAGVAAGVCPFTWTRDLTTGSSGADVMKLQQFLNADPDTRVAATGVGSAGMETEYFGGLTAAAVSKFQVKYRAQVLSPLGLVNPTGYFGAGSRAQANDLCIADAPSTGDDDDDDMTDDDDDMDDDEDFELSGEGTLEDVSIDDEEDDVEEGEEEVAVATVTIEAENGDIEVARMTFVASSSAGNTEDEAWEVFEAFSLWVDGDMIAEFDASDEDEYLDEDINEFRFSNLDLIVEEDEEVEVTIAASVRSDVDGVPEEWSIGVTEMRYFDADGVATNESSVGALGGSDFAASGGAEYETFNVVAEGDGDDFSLSSSNEDPDSATIAVEEDEAEDVMIFAFELDADGSDSDISIDEIVLSVSGTANDPDSDNLDEFISDFYLEIDGETFSVEDYDGDANTEQLVFDIDGDIVVDADEELVAMLFAEFEVDDDFASATVTAETVSADVEGADDFTVTDTVSGEEHTVVSAGIIVPQDGVETDTDSSGTDDTTGIFTIDFEVTAFEGDFYIEDVATTSASADTGVYFTVEGPGGATTVVSGVLSSTGDEDSGFFLIEEGQTETLTLTVTVTTDTDGLYRVRMNEVWYSDDKTAGDADDAVRTLTPASDYRTAYEQVNS